MDSDPDPRLARRQFLNSDSILSDWSLKNYICFVGLPPSVHGSKNVPVNARVSGYLDLNIINLSLFAKFSLKLGRLKVHALNKKNLVLMGETLQKK